MPDIDAYDVRGRVDDPDHLWWSVAGGFAIAAVLAAAIEIILVFG